MASDLRFSDLVGDLRARRKTIVIITHLVFERDRFDLLADLANGHPHYPLKLPVISTTLASEVRGARTAEANTAPIAITAYKEGCPAAAPRR